MQQKTLLKKIGECLSIEGGSIKPETKLKDLDGWDIVGRMLVTSVLEQFFKKTVDPAVLEKCKTVSDIVDLVKDDIE